MYLYVSAVCVCVCVRVVCVCSWTPFFSHLYSINGKLLLSEAVDQMPASQLVHQQLLVTGGQMGHLLFKDAI